MPFLAKVAKPFSRVRAFFARKRTSSLSTSPAGQSHGSDKPHVGPIDAPPSQPHQVLSQPTAISAPSQAASPDARDSIPATGSAQLPASSAVVESSQGAGDQARYADGPKHSWLSHGFAAFKTALHVTKEFAEPFPPLKYAAEGLLMIMEGFEKVKDVQEEFEYAAETLTFMQTACKELRMQPGTSESLNASMESVAQTMRNVEQLVRAKLERGIGQRIWETASDVKEVADALRKLGDVVNRFNTSVSVSIHARVIEGLQQHAFDSLHAVENAQFDSSGNGRPCTQGTRTEFLQDLLTWAKSTDKRHICWVNGAAGSGKTTIAHTLCSSLQRRGLLGGSFFCTRNAQPERRSIEFIFSTLARLLAYHDGAYAHSLAEVLKNPGAGSVNASKQLTDLIAAPILSAHPPGSSSLNPIRILVIDALDECDDDPSTVNNLIRKLLVESGRLPLKFLITSRPESHITQVFKTANQDSCLVRRVQDIPDNTAKTDIRTYLDTELKDFGLNNRLPDSWPSETQIQALSKQAGTLFIYASTACKYICQFGDDPVARLNDLVAVHAEPWRGIDPMYEFVLDQAWRSKKGRRWNATKRCLQAIVCLSHPLSLRDLGDLLRVDHEGVRTALIGLRSLLNIPSSDETDSITIFHASFPDYLLDADRSRDKDWSLVGAEGHRDLLQQCMAIMTSNLCFNISNSHSSYASNEDQRVKTISGALRYSCLHWIDHLEGCGHMAISELTELNKLLMERFLYWLEVLSMSGEVRRAPAVMTRLLNWLHAPTSVASVPSAHSQRMTAPSTTPDDLVQFSKDARDFVNRFAEPIENSCPHIYLSALASTTSGSMIRTTMSPMFRGLPNMITQQTQHVSPIFILHGHEGIIKSVAFSRDGRRIVSGSSDGIIRLWDAATGAAIGDPLRGHEGYIYSVAFSPDGTRVVSGSDDFTIRVWDAATGAAIGDPLRGHEGWVMSVAFSPDGTRVVSGSNDRTIRVWDAATGAAIGDPLRGHEGYIYSVAFSPDGTRVVSGSDDRTIRVWDAATGATIGDPLRGHEGLIYSVAFSPDGTRVVSGSSDRTIRVWDAATGAAIGDPLCGHEGSIDSVAFSPGGTSVVSTSSDRTTRRWDAESRVLLGRDGQNNDTSGVDSAHSRGSGVPSATRFAHAGHPVSASDNVNRIAFSPIAAHATGIDALLPPQFDRDPRDAFTLDSDGWLRGPNDELFLWILPQYRLGLWWPRTAAIMGTHPVMLDLSGFAHGEDWTECFQGDEYTRMSVQ